MPTATTEALEMLAAICELELMTSAAYMELLRAADRIRRERGATRLGRVHIEQAMDEMFGEPI